MENPTEIAELFKYLEQNFDVSKFCYKDVNFWPLIRNEVRMNLGFNRMVSQDYTAKCRKKSLSDLVKTPYRQIKKLRAKNKYVSALRSQNNKYQIITYPNTFFVDLVKEKKYCRYIDPYYEVLEKALGDINYLGFLSENEKQPNTLHKIDFIDLSYYNQYLSLCNYLQSFNSSRAKEINKVKKALDEANALIEKRFNIRPFYHGVIKACMDVYDYKEFFDSLFRKSKIETVFIEDYHIPLQMSLCVSAKDNNVKVVEIQHGAFDTKYYPFVNTKLVQKSLPDHMWCWSENDKHVLESQNPGFKYLKPFIGGNMWLKKFVNNEIEIVDEQTENYFKSVTEKYKKVILIALQPVYLLMDVMYEVISNAPKDWFFLIRFHPLNTTLEEKNQVVNKLSKFINVESNLSTKANLYYLYKRSHYQLTHSSASAIEALVFGLPTIICSESGKELYKEHINKEVVFFSKKAEEIIKLILENGQPDPVNSSEYIIQSDQMKAINEIKVVLN